MPTRAARLTLDPVLLEEARALGVDIPRAVEAGLRAALKQARTEAWKRENAEAIAAYNDYIEKYGLPLEKYRKF